MTSWKTYKLGDVVNILDNRRIPLSAREREQRHGEYPYYGAQGIIDYVDEYLFDGTYLLIAEDGENLRSKKQNIAQLVSGKYWVNNHAHILESNGLCDIRYICYLLNIIDISGYITGSAQPKLNQANLLAISISLPPLEEQRRIAGILSAIDDKIENNRRINANLESQAQALYKQWFVDFEFPNEDGKPYKSSGGKMVDSELGQIPEGWRMQTFGDLIKPQKGKNITRAQVTIGSVPVVAGGLMPSCYHNTSNTHCPVVTISASGANAGYVKMYHMPIWAADCSYIDDTISKYVHFAYVFLTYNQTSIYHKQQGCAQPHIYPSHLMELQFICPTLDILDKFESWSKKIYKLIGTNIQEIETLATLRDTLLPKLMNGKVKL